jgi:hypothetical protein
MRVSKHEVAAAPTDAHVGERHVVLLFRGLR